MADENSKNTLANEEEIGGESEQQGATSKIANEAADAARTAKGVATAAAKASAGDEVGAAIEVAKVAPSIAKFVIAGIALSLVPFLLIGYLLNPIQIFHAAVAYWTNVDDTWEEEDADYGELLTRGQSGSNGVLQDLGNVKKMVTSAVKKFFKQLGKFFGDFTKPVREAFSSVGTSSLIVSHTGGEATTGTGPGLPGHAVVMFGSDYQKRSDSKKWKKPNVTVTELIKSVKSAGLTVDNLVFCGDYCSEHGSSGYNGDPKSGIQDIKNAFKEEMPNVKQEDMIFVQGNHDAMVGDISKSGLHDFGTYLVYVLNTKNDFPSKQGKDKCKNVVIQSANRLKECLSKLEEQGDSRPIFVAAHVPLHFTGRTGPLRGTGDNMYSRYMFEVLNAYGKNLNIVYLFGHNHDDGWDSYLGGSCIFRKEGDWLLIPKEDDHTGCTYSFTKETINFTYLNAGYVGYFDFHDDKKSESVDDTLTTAVCEIDSDHMTFSRYSTNGLHNLSGTGGKNRLTKNGKEEDDYIPSKYYGEFLASPYTVPLKTVDPNSKTNYTASESATGGTDYENVDEEELVEEDEILLEEDQEKMDKAAALRHLGTKYRILARAGELRETITSKKGKIWDAIQKQAKEKYNSSNPEANKVPGSKVNGPNYNISSVNVTSLSDRAIEQAMAAYTVQMQGYDEADAEYDEDGKSTDNNGFHNYMKWLGYQPTKNWLKTFLDVGSYDPWKGTFLPQPLFEERMKWQGEYAGLKKQVDTYKNMSDEEVKQCTGKTMSELKSERDEAKKKVDNYNKYQTAFVNYILKVDNPETEVLYTYLDGSGNEMTREEAKKKVEEANEADYQAALKAYKAQKEAAEHSDGASNLDPTMSTDPVPGTNTNDLNGEGLPAAPPVEPKREDFNSHTESEFIKETRIDVETQVGISFADDDTITSICGFISGGTEGIPDGSTAQYDYNPQAEEQDNYYIERAKAMMNGETPTEEYSGPDNFQVDNNADTANGTEENSETPATPETNTDADAEYYSGLGSELDKLEEQDQAATDNNNKLQTLDVDSMFGGDESKDFYYNENFGFTKEILENYKTALKWGRSDDGTLVTRWTIGTGKEVKENDADYNNLEKTFVRQDSYQISYYYDVLKKGLEAAGINEQDSEGTGDNLVRIALAEFEKAKKGEAECKTGKKYQDWAGIGNGPWCCAFVYWCADQCGYIGECFGSKTAYCPTAWDWFSSQSRTHMASEGYVPTPGDLIFFSYGGTRVDHIGIVEKVENNQVYTIEGNSSDTIRNNVFPLNKPAIYGYAHPKFPGFSFTGDYDRPQDYFYAYGIQEGYTPAGVAGIMGNIFRECSPNCNDSNMEKEYQTVIAGKDKWNLGESGGVIGIAQWTDPGRKAKLKKYCSSHGYDLYSIEGQTGYLFHELSSGYADSRKACKTSNDPAAVAGKFCDDFEDPDPAMAYRDHRQRIAQGYLEYYKNFNPSSVMGGYSARGNYIECPGNANATKFLQTLSKIAQMAEDNRWKYRAKGSPDTLGGAKKEKKMNCARYVCYALQECGYLPKGAQFFSRDNGKISDMKVAKKIVEHGAAIKRPNMTVKEMVKKKYLQPGDILCMGHPAHTCVFAGYDKNGTTIYWSAGGSATSHGHFTVARICRHVDSYDGRYIKYLIRLNS